MNRCSSRARTDSSAASTPSERCDGGFGERPDRCGLADGLGWARLSGLGHGYGILPDVMTGTLVWRFRSLPSKRRIMVYGRWYHLPANSACSFTRAWPTPLPELSSATDARLAALDAASGKFKVAQRHGRQADNERIRALRQPPSAPCLVVAIVVCFRQRRELSVP